MDARAVIAALVEGRGLDEDGARWFADALASGGVSDAQAGAFAMAVRLRGLSSEARTALTLGMRDSGHILRWDLPGPAIDKHSTGGLGDAVSLPLAPALAMCGGYVPMISGRGLGHTGGTLDKLEAIPGLRTDLSEEAFRGQVRELGCAIVSASGDMAPADRRLYAIRDVTGTVESIDLITASILSKKLAAGLDALLLDVKAGSGAFMETEDDARTLAQALVETSNAAGCRTAAMITDMNQPLAPALGNALEIVETMKVLEGEDGPLAALTVILGGALLALGGLADDAGQGEARMRTAIASGAALERFGQMIAAQGGATDFAETWRAQLPAAGTVRDLVAGRDGTLTAIDGRALGMAVVRLGGGRLREGDVIDPAVGLANVLRLGARVEKGTVLAQIHAADDAAADAAQAAVNPAFTISDAPSADEQPLVHERLRC